MVAFKDMASYWGQEPLKVACGVPLLEGRRGEARAGMGKWLGMSALEVIVFGLGMSVVQGVSYGASQIKSITWTFKVRRL